MIRKSKVHKVEIMKLKQKANKEFITKIRKLKSTQPRDYGKPINKKHHTLHMLKPRPCSNISNLILKVVICKIT